MRFYAKVGLILTLLFAPAVLGCASKKLTPATPVAARAMTADQVIVRVNEVIAAINAACGPALACQPNTINTNLARELVQGCIDLDKVLKDSAPGWKATVKSTWNVLRQKFAGITNIAVQSAFGLLDVAVGAL